MPIQGWPTNISHRKITYLLGFESLFLLTAIRQIVDNSTAGAKSQINTQARSAHGRERPKAS
jgi:hypothetical protein